MNPKYEHGRHVLGGDEQQHVMGTLQLSIGSQHVPALTLTCTGQGPGIHWLRRVCLQLLLADCSMRLARHGSIEVLAGGRAGSTEVVAVHTMQYPGRNDYETAQKRGASAFQEGRPSYAPVPVTAFGASGVDVLRAPHIPYFN